MCSNCNESDIAVLHFHHIDKSNKSFNITKIRECRWSDIERELNKCVLLCANCHAESHYELDRTKIKYTYRHKNKNIYLNYKKTEQCENCGYSKCISALDFHHKNMLEKSFNIFLITNGINEYKELPDKIKQELDKCVVVCKNCHAKKHFDYDKFSKFKDKIYNKIKSYKEYDKYDVNEIINLKLKGFKNIEIAKILGCCKSTITYKLKKYL